MKLDDLLAVMRSLADEALAESWDKVGLHAGDPALSIERALVCIDFTPAVLAEAIEQGAQLVIAYHPPIFEPLTTLATTSAKGGLMWRTARAGIALYSPHTALDAASDGVNDWLADGLGAEHREPIRPAGEASTAPGAACKLVVFTPSEAADEVRAALAAAGAGRIGAYDQCSFSVAGEGTFRGGAGAKPTVGQAGQLERAPELRMEMVCPVDRLAAVVRALIDSHPYEEPAYDIIPLTPSPAPPQTTDADAPSSQTSTGAPGRGPGQGRRFTLSTPATVGELAERLKHHLGVRTLEAVTEDLQRPCRVVALCAGAGGSLLQDAGPIDLFVTGEMRHHDQLAAAGRGVSLLLAGHTETERPYLPVYARRLADAAPDVRFDVSQADHSPRQLV